MRRESLWISGEGAFETGPKESEKTSVNAGVASFLCSDPANEAGIVVLQSLLPVISDR